MSLDVEHLLQRPVWRTLRAVFILAILGALFVAYVLLGGLGGVS